MFRALLGGGRDAASTHSLSSLDQVAALEDAMQAASYIMNDDIETAEKRLSEGGSVFHKLGLGLSSFLRAVLGFEREMMLEASERLAEAELAANEQLNYARRHPNSSRASVYSPGSEYALCLAEAQIMAAVVAVLTESLGESIKGFYKLRKAFFTLDTILAEERKYLAGIGGTSTFQEGTASSSEQSLASSKEILTETSRDSDEFVDASETQAAEKALQDGVSHLTVKDEQNSSATFNPLAADEGVQTFESLRRRSSQFSEGPDAVIFGGNTVDLFTHAGSNMCYGILLIVLSLIPPSFSTLARIAGFKGDRKRGLELLWQATKFHNNINGAFAGLVLMGYYNGMLGFSDIIPTSGKGAYPRARCQALLKDFRQRYPESRLWLLEEARMMSQEKRLKDAVVMLRALPDSKLKQVLALQWFELSLDSMYLHDYDTCSTAFVKMISLNKWSHGLYYYIAGCAQVEHYRLLLATDKSAAEEHAAQAEKLLQKAPEHIGKRRIMAKQLPFDVFVSRKIQKWEQRAKERNTRLVDAIGVAPLEEMIYFWNGYKRMSVEDLEVSLQRLEWSITTTAVPWESEELDEHCMYFVLKAAILRNLGRTSEAKAILQESVMSRDWHLFKGGLKDNWPAPVSRYEMACNFWREYQASGERKCLDECLEYLELVAKWEAFDLDARFGVRIATAKETVQREMTMTGVQT